MAAQEHLTGVESILYNLKHYLPTQQPLTNFIHHNTLHAFQHQHFHKGLSTAAELFGYKTYLRLDEYRSLYSNGKIRPEILDKVITEHKGKDLSYWKDIAVARNFDITIKSRTGELRVLWKNAIRVNLSKEIHPLLFRLISNYIDQGIAIKDFPVKPVGLLSVVQELENNGLVSLFKTETARQLLFKPNLSIEELCERIVGEESLYEQYLFDQQFEHPGWSGMVAVLENDNSALLDKRSISLRELILLELLLEVDVLEYKLGKDWKPLSKTLLQLPKPLFADFSDSEYFDVLALWQEAFEWSYFEMVVAGIQKVNQLRFSHAATNSFQAVFCIDDREGSLRRYLEQEDSSVKTFATAGFFNVEFYFQPEGGKFYTKVCPAPVTPKYLIKEVNKKTQLKKDVHFTKQTHGLFGGFLSQTIGFWSAIKLMSNIFKPEIGPATNYSFSHMDKEASLTIENLNPEQTENGLQIGFTLEEMTNRVEGLLKSIGLVNNFATLVYFVGHGASSVNNTYYAGYDCGACCGRPGSVNARVAAHMANNHQVRELLKQRGLTIPDTTQFVGALHDTTRDEIDFFDLDKLTAENKQAHLTNLKTFLKALDLNAKERSRRFLTMNNHVDAATAHKEVLRRSVALFEPRSEYNHATNALCVVGRRDLTDHLFLDRRSFLNSYDYRVDPEGNYLFGILKAIAPVCGGINLEYYFSRVDNQKLGAGSKLPHNVLGLVGVANGADGDLRTGLPQQMVEIHDPLRLLVVVEHLPNVVLTTLKKNQDTYEWFKNYWIHLMVIHPETGELFKYKQGAFIPYQPCMIPESTAESVESVVERKHENIEPFIFS